MFMLDDRNLSQLLSENLIIVLKWIGHQILELNKMKIIENCHCFVQYNLL